MALCLSFASYTHSLAETKPTNNKGIYVGLRAGAFHYWRYNYSEANFPDKGYFQVKNKPLINGGNIGLDIVKPISEHWKCGLSIDYTKQTQKYYNSRRGIQMNSVPDIHIPNGRTDAKFKYWIFSPYISYSILLSKKHDTRLEIAQGVSLSYMQDYDVYSKFYYVSFHSNNSYTIENEISELTELKNSQFSFSTTNNPNMMNYVINVGRPFNYWLLGSSTSVSIKHKLYKKLPLYLNAGMRFGYDFTNQRNSSNPNVRDLTGDTNSDDKFKHKTHNIRLGMEVGVLYQFLTKRKKKQEVLP